MTGGIGATHEAKAEMETGQREEEAAASGRRERMRTGGARKDWAPVENRAEEG